MKPPEITVGFRAAGRGRLLLLLLLGFSVSRPPAARAAEAEAEAAYLRDGAVEAVRLRYGRAEEIERDLKEIGRSWRIYPSVRFLRYGFPAGDEALLLFGETGEVRTARMIAEHLDGFYSPAPAAALPLISRVPLEFSSPERIRKELLEISRSAGLNWEKGDFLIFPPGRRGGLFFLGPAEEARKVGEVTRELDLPRRSGPVDLGLASWHAVRRDFFNHFTTVFTLAVSALALVLLHFALVKIPGLGRRYERWFTLIWTRLLDNVRGRDFALEVIRKIADTAIVAAEKETPPPLSSGGERSRPAGGESPLRISRRLLRFRGLDPDDPEVKFALEKFLAARRRAKE